MNEDPDNLSNNQALDKLDPVFLEAHSVHSEIYHSTVQVPGNPQTSNQNSPNQNNQINPEIHSGFLANKPGSQIKDPSENPSTLMQREQLNEDSTNCADTVCLVVAVLVVLTSMIGFIVILTKGTVNELVVVDSDGNRCGGSSIQRDKFQVGFAFPSVLINPFQIPVFIVKEMSRTMIPWDMKTRTYACLYKKVSWKSWKLT